MTLFSPEYLKISLSHLLDVMLWKSIKFYHTKSFFDNEIINDKHKNKHTQVQKLKEVSTVTSLDFFLLYLAYHHTFAAVQVGYGKG